ncbi:MAG: endonuclease/exonuclease/phosphatase family protein [Chloroflexota bacterium]
MSGTTVRDLPLRIATINTWKGDGPYEARLEALCAQLRGIEADVVALQEALVAVDGSLSTPACLARELGMTTATFAHRRKLRMVEGREVDCWSGLALLSRWPIVDVLTHALPSDDEDGERGVLLAAIETPAGLLRLANTHLTHLRARSALRRAQLDAVLADPFLARPAAARLVCGDMNATPGTPEIGGVLGDTRLWHVVDAYEAANGAEMRATMSDRNDHVRPGTGERVLDYIFSLADTPHAQPYLLDARVVLDRPSDCGVYPSDHFGVMVSLAS